MIAPFSRIILSTATLVALVTSLAEETNPGERKSNRTTLSSEITLGWQDGVSTISVFRNGALVQNIERTLSVSFYARIGDFNFDGIDDIEIIRDRGTEEYFDIYIYDRKSAQFRKNEELSKLPCPDTEGAFVVAKCFTSSACEHWTEQYKWKGERLSLIKRVGYTCDPATGRSFRYNEEYLDGKQVSQTTEEIVQ